MMMDAKLREKAAQLGITVDSRWSDTVIQAKIDEKEADNKAAGDGGIIPGLTEDGPSKQAIAGAAVSDEGKVMATEATPKAVHGGVVAGDEKGLLITKANQLNILVDDKWDVARLRAEIQMAREGRADLQVKGAKPPSEYSDVNFDPATKADKKGVQPGIIAAPTVTVPGVTIAGEPAVAVAGPTGGAVAKSAVVSPATSSSATEATTVSTKK
jgi:hypothetical protein